MNNIQSEQVCRSLNRYIKYNTGSSDLSLSFIQNINLIEVIKKYEEDRNINAFYLILSLFNSDVEEQVYDAEDHRLMSVKYVTSRKSGNKVRIDWESENPIKDMLENIKKKVEKGKKKQVIKFLILG